MSACPAGSSSSPRRCRTPTGRSTSATSWSTSRPTSGCASSACRAHEVHFVCADDAHGAPIMLKAEAEGVTPQALVARIAADAAEAPRRLPHRLRPLALDRFAGERRALAGHLPPAEGRGPHLHQAGRAVLRPGQGDVPAGPLHQGRVPEVRRQGPVRRRLRESAARSTRRPTSRIRTRRSRAPRRCCKTSEHFFFRLSDPRASSSCAAGRDGKRLQPEVVEQGAGVAGRRPATRASPTGTSRATRRTSAFRFPMRRASTSTSGSTRRSATSRA